MLREFLSSNRDELINRCRSKVSLRDSPPVTSLELEHGVPLFLDQLVEALRCEEEARATARPDELFATPAAVESSRAAAVLHGKELLARGFSVEQVVHDYGDICQAVTELAREGNVTITVDEFHTFNRLLDNAMAAAVGAYGQSRDEAFNLPGNQDLHEQLGILADEHQKLVETALKALAALKVGNLGLMGATGSLMEQSLLKLRDLSDKSLPALRLLTRMTTSPKP